MRIINIALATIAISSAASLANAQTSQNYFDGFHVGAGIETQDLSIHSGPSDLAGKIKANSDGVNAHLAAGWDKALDANWVVGGEVSTDFGGARTLTAAGSNGAMTVKPDAAWTLSARAGYQVMPGLLAYGRVGYEWQGLKRQAAFTDGTSPYASDKDSGGAVLGVGVEKAISDRFGLRAEYDRANLSHGVDENNLVLSVHYKL